MRVLHLSFVACLIWGVAAFAQDYTIQPGDTLEVTVLEDPGLNRQVLVRPDGKISLPLAGTVQAGGQTPEAVQAAIRRSLADDFVTPPTVSVALTGVAAANPVDAEAAAVIYIVGAVNNPGRYDVALPLDVLQALALSGGPGVFAATRKIQVRRRAAAVETVLLFDYESVAEGVVPSTAIPLADGDVIVVPERGLFD